MSFKRIWLKKIKKIKFGEKNECKALQIFKIWYTRNKLSANVFLKQSLKTVVSEYLNDEQRTIQVYLA